MRLARLESSSFEDRVPKASAQIVLDEATVCLPLEGVIDFAAGARAACQGNREDHARTTPPSRAGSTIPGFVAKAPEDVLEEARERKTDLEARKHKLGEALKRLG